MATFETFAAKCAASIALELLVAIAAVESGGRSLAIRDGTKLIHVSSPGEGVAVAVGVADQGRDVGIGLLGLTARQLATAGLSIGDGFEPCAAMRAASVVMAHAADAAMKRGVIGAGVDRASVRAWWRPDGRFQSAALYEQAVATQRALSATLIKRELGGTPPNPAREPERVATVEPVERRTPPKEAAKPSTPPPCWDVFARMRFGAQCNADESPATIRPAADQARPSTASGDIVVQFGR